MHVTALFADDLYDDDDHGVSSLGPQWEAVRDAISALDGIRRTIVVVSDRDGGESSLTVSGQWDSRGIVNATGPDQTYYTLVDSSRAQLKRLRYIGGQDTEVDEMTCVPLEWATSAARTFFETGQLDSRLVWRRDY